MKINCEHNADGWCFECVERAILVERERIAKMGDDFAGSGPEEFDYPGVYYAILDYVKSIRKGNTEVLY